eukprot:CAMPEP_0113496976 /NCGR_PEP_ID=MMETSP0014_2-20120614/30394_1 /TAXON_ID=2857 /ORGANISM="Nitzschia sp." /LENGTH=258 /DNA_ID=CAMNT_0000390905 /DNA_START=97 /DNA_END=873 /DNA_ORIENTATION=- /assembly_acc=CAM_ASM_000159
MSSSSSASSSIVRLLLLSTILVQETQSFAAVVVPSTSRSSPSYYYTFTTLGVSTNVNNEDTIISPFDHSNDEDGSTVDGSGGDVVAPDSAIKVEGPLELTWDNVELVLDEMRPFLIQDGGNVAIQEIDGPVVRLELQGACGTCPSSTQTMKMGLERGLKEKIPEIQEVIQAMPEGPDLNEEQINVVLDGVRPFLQVAGGSIDIDRVEGVDGLQPTIWLNMEGASASLNSVKLEIAQRLQRHFMMAGLRVEWVPPPVKY